LFILSHQPFDIGTKFARLLPAQPCVLCGTASLKGLICKECDAELPRLPEAHCPVCALPSPAGGVCGQCLRHPPRFDRCVAAFSYAFPMDKLIQELKYRERLILVDHLADALAQRMTVRPDFLVALPLHPARLRERGFNQSLLLARRISRRLGIPLLPDLCERVRNTPPQSGLPWKERDKNMRQAFACKSGDHIKGKHVAIVDDVMTTGASTGELARMLKHVGAGEVSVWVIARTLPRDR
jgi:ComF family protein